MKRKSKPTALLTADWHIRDDKPVCRTDDYMKTQTKKIKFILSLAQEYKCPILIAGDLGNKPMWGDPLLNYFIDILNEFQDVKIYTICGQHDLPNHRLDKWDEGGLGVLNGTYINVLTEKHDIIQPFSYGEKIKESDCSIALIHSMVIQSQSKKLWEGQKAHSALWFLKKYPCYDLIICGDNHQPFGIQYEGRWLVNPGSIMRMTTAQIDHKPCVYLWYAEENEIEKVFLPIEDNVIDTSHIDDVKERDDRIEAYINSMKGNEEIGLSFNQNMINFFNKNKTKKAVEEKVWNAIEE